MGGRVRGGRVGGSGWMGTEKCSLCENSKKNLGGGGQGGCEWRSEAFVKIQKKHFYFGGGGGRVGGGGGGGGWGCQGGWEWRIEAFVKIQKKKNFFWGGGGRVGRGEGGGLGRAGWGVRVDVNGEVVFVKIQKKQVAQRQTIAHLRASMS